MANQDWMVRALDRSGAVRIIGVELADVANRMIAAHELGPDAARLGAETMVAAALLSAHIKGDERVTVHIASDAPKGGMMVEVDAEGQLRGVVKPADLQHQGPIKGLLYSIKTNASKELYRGITPIDDQTLDQAIQAHLGQSSQVDVYLDIEVVQAADGSIAHACGTFVERLPEERDRPSISLPDFQEQYASMQGRGAASSIIELRAGILRDDAVHILEERAPVWHCRCSREKVLSALASLGGDQLLAMAREDHGARAGCEYCATVYQVSEGELLAMAGDA